MELDENEEMGGEILDLNEDESVNESDILTEDEFDEDIDDDEEEIDIDDEDYDEDDEETQDPDAIDDDIDIMISDGDEEDDETDEVDYNDGFESSFDAGEELEEDFDDDNLEEE